MATANAKKAPVKRTTKAPAKRKAMVFDDSLMHELEKASEIEKQVTASDRNSFLWVKCLNHGANETIEGDEKFIKGAKPGCFVIGQQKLNLGKKFYATVIGALKVYKEVQPPRNPSEFEQTVGFWNTADAAKVPVVGYFDRPLSNGNVLKPMHWLFLHLHDYPELEGVLMPFQSVGNKKYEELMKMLKPACNILPERMIEISSNPEKNKTYNKVYFYPAFDIVEDKNFEYDGEGIMPGDLDEEEVEVILKKYTELQGAISKHILVQNRGDSVKNLIPYDGEDDDFSDEDFEESSF